jgi:uncharacterized membrane protein
VDFFGIPIPDEGPVFLAVVVLHIVAGLVSVAAGLVAILSRKGGRVHIRSGRIYVGGIATLFATMVILAAIRWPHDNHLAILGLIAFVATVLGFVNRRRHRADPWHIAAMGISYVAMLTAFYVDNGPFLPLWNLLPAWMLWVIPSIVGAPLIARAIVRRARRSTSSAG